MLFPDAEIEYLEEIACQVTSMDEAAGYVLNKLSTDLDTSASLKDLIDLFVKKNSLGNSADDEHVAFDRDTLWMGIIKFYKKSLVVMLTGFSFGQREELINCQNASLCSLSSKRA